MKFNKEVILALSVISRLGDEPTTVANLSVELGTTEDFLQKIVMKLRRHGLVRVKRGPGGGVVRTKEMSEITLLDVYEAFDRALIKTHGHSILERVSEEFLNILAETKVGPDNNRLVGVTAAGSLA